MAGRIKTFCFIYSDIDRNTCYFWIEALNLEVAKLKFKEEVPEYFKILDIQETFTWK